MSLHPALRALANVKQKPCMVLPSPFPDHNCNPCLPAGDGAGRASLAAWKPKIHKACPRSLLWPSQSKPPCNGRESAADAEEAGHLSSRGWQSPAHSAGRSPEPPQTCPSLLSETWPVHSLCFFRFYPRNHIFLTLSLLEKKGIKCWAASFSQPKQMCLTKKKLGRSRRPRHRQRWDVWPQHLCLPSSRWLAWWSRAAGWPRCGPPGAAAGSGPATAAAGCSPPSGSGSPREGLLPRSRGSSSGTAAGIPGAWGEATQVGKGDDMRGSAGCVWGVRLILTGRKSGEFLVFVQTWLR